MKTKYITYIATALLTVLVITTSAQAATFLEPTDPNGSVSVNDTDPVKDLNVIGTNIIVNAPINGDLVSAGQTILTTGSISNSAFLLGSNITSQSSVGHHIRAVGQTVVISGSVAGDAYVAGSSITVAKGAVINGDIFVAGNSITIDGTIKGNVTAYASTVTVNGAVNGNLNYHASQQATVGNEALISGTTKYTKIVSHTDSFTKNMLWINVVIWLGTILLLMLVVQLWPKKSHKLVSSFSEQPMVKFGIGFLASILLPIISFMLLFTVIGIPIAMALFTTIVVTWLIASLLSRLALGSLIVKYLAHKDTDQVGIKEILVGASAFALINLIPFIGPVVDLAVTTIATGTLIESIKPEKRS